MFKAFGIIPFCKYGVLEEVAIIFKISQGFFVTVIIVAVAIMPCQKCMMLRFEKDTYGEVAKVVKCYFAS